MVFVMPTIGVLLERKEDWALAVDDVLISAGGIDYDDDDDDLYYVNNSKAEYGLLLLL